MGIASTHHQCGRRGECADLSELAVDGTQLAAWVGSDGNVQVATGSAGSFGSPVSVPTSSRASSPQAAIINGMPTVYFIAGNTIESSTFDNLVWSTPAPVATLGTGTISDLRVDVDHERRRRCGVAA